MSIIVNTLQRYVPIPDVLSKFKKSKDQLLQSSLQTTKNRRLRCTRELEIQVSFNAKHYRFRTFFEKGDR